MDGRAYVNKQGTGYATTLGDSQAIDNLGKSALLAQKSASKASSKDSGFDTKGVWHYYSGAVKEAVNKWYDSSADLVTKKGINDIWNTSDKDAIAKQIEAGDLRAGIENIKQAETLYNKAIADIGTRGDKYTDDYIQAVMDFPKQTSFEQIASGQWQFPVAKFKEPVTVYNNFLVAGYKKLKADNPNGIPTDESLANHTLLYFQSPEYEGDSRAVKQQFARLTDDDKKKFQAIAENQGLPEPWMGLAMDNLKKTFDTRSVNMTELAIEYAKKAPLEDVDWKRGEEGITKYGSKKQLSSDAKDYPEKMARSHFVANPDQLKDEGAMKQLGVSMDIPIAEREKEAIKAFAKDIRNSVSTKTSSGTIIGDGSGMTKEDETKNFSDWWKSVTSGNPLLSEHAANWLFGDNINGKISGAKIVKGGELDFVNDLKSDPIFPVISNVANESSFMKITYDNHKEASQAQEKSLKLMIATYGADDPLVQSLQSFYQKNSDGRTVYVEMKEENVQIFKELHRASANKKKEGYKFGFDQSTPNTNTTGRREIKH